VKKIREVKEFNYKYEIIDRGVFLFLKVLLKRRNSFLKHRIFFKELFKQRLNNSKFILTSDGMELN
jgi:transposase-like protein